MIFKRKKNNRFYSVALLAGLSIPFFAEAQKEQPAVVDTAVNSRFNEIKPVFSPDGTTLYFTRSNHPLNAGGRRDRGDVWQARVLAPGSYTDVQLADKAFNTSEMNAVVGFSENGKEVYFQTYDPESKGKRQTGIYKMPVQGGKAQPVSIHYFFLLKIIHVTLSSV